MQHRVMEWQNSLYYLIPTFFLLLLIFPLVFTLKLAAIPFQNNFVVALYIFNIKLLYFEVSVGAKKIRIENDKNVLYKEIEFNQAEFDTMQHFLKKVSKKIKLKDVEVVYNVGVGDAFSSAIVCGVLNQIIVQTFLFLRQIKPTVSVRLNDNVSYNQMVCAIAINNKFSFSLLDIVTTFVYAFATRNKKM